MPKSQLKVCAMLLDGVHCGVVESIQIIYNGFRFLFSPMKIACSSILITSLMGWYVLALATILPAVVTLVGPWSALMLKGRESWPDWFHSVTRAALMPGSSPRCLSMKTGFRLELINNN